MKKDSKPPTVISAEEQEQKLRELLTELAGPNEPAKAQIERGVLRLMFRSPKQYEQPFRQIKGKGWSKEHIEQIGRRTKELTELIKGASAEVHRAFPSSPSQHDLSDLHHVAQNILEEVPRALERVEHMALPKPASGQERKLHKRSGKEVYGRRPNQYAKQLELGASKIFTSFTGEAANARTNYDTDEPYGPYFEFLSKVLDILGVDANPSYLIQARKMRSKPV